VLPGNPPFLFGVRAGILTPVKGDRTREPNVSSLRCNEGEESVEWRPGGMIVTKAENWSDAAEEMASNVKGYSHGVMFRWK